MKHVIWAGAFIVAVAGFTACGSDNSSNPDEEFYSSAIESGNSSAVANGSSSAAVNENSSANPSEGTSSSSEDDSNADTTKISYSLKPFDGPLANPHKGFTVPTGGTWVFVPEFEYGPYGSLKNKAWDLVSYGSGYQQWNTLNPKKGEYNWTELDKLLEELAKHGMGYARRAK